VLVEISMPHAPTPEKRIGVEPPADPIIDRGPSGLEREDSHIMQNAQRSQVLAEALDAIVHQQDVNEKLRARARLPKTLSAFDARNLSTGERFVVVVRGQDSAEDWTSAAVWVIDRRRQYAGLFFPSLDPQYPMRPVTIITDIDEMNQPDKDPDIYETFEKHLRNR
jgi:hypothetical protein